MDPARESFTFMSDDDRLVGELYLPADRDAVAAVVTSGPLTSVKEQATGNYAVLLRSGDSPPSPSTIGRSARATVPPASSRTRRARPEMSAPP